MKVLIIGFYGAPNVGDEALLDVLKKEIESRGGDIVVASLDPLWTRRVHGVESIYFHDLGAIARTLMWADVLIMGGGGIFQDHHPFNIDALYDPLVNDIAAYARPMLLARQFNVPVFIWGHGVGPLTTSDGRLLVRDLFENAAAISVRDEESLSLLREIGVDQEISVGADPGWLFRRCHSLPGPSNQGDAAEVKSQASTPILAIVVREWEKGEWKAKLIEALISTLPENWTVHWIPFQAETNASGALTDITLVNELRAALPERLQGQCISPGTPSEAWNLLVRADAVFSMRLHASVLALLAGKTVVGLEYDEKMTRAHVMAGVPSALRLGIGDSESRYVEALNEAISRQWRPDGRRLSELEASAESHIRIIDQCQAYAGRHRQWSAQQFDWLGVWLQQTLAGLRVARETSRRAHDLLAYRDSQLSEKDALLDGFRTAEKEYISSKKSLMDQLKAAEKEYLDAQSLLMDRNGQLLERDMEIKRMKSLIDEFAAKNAILEHDLMNSSAVMADMEAIENALAMTKVDLAEAVDDIQKKSDYIEDKEIYIATLQKQVGSLQGEIDQLRAELYKSRVLSRRWHSFVVAVNKVASFGLGAPGKVLNLWRRHGLKVVLEQCLLWLKSERGPIKTESFNNKDIKQPNKPVRNERLLVLTDSLMRRDGWPSRALQLAKAADRAGFFVRVWCATEESASALVSLGFERFSVDATGLLQAIHPEQTRVLVATSLPASLDVARAARERGGEIIVDLDSLNAESLSEDARRSISSIASRAISSSAVPIGWLPGMDVEQLSDAGDNEVFDSYKTYAMPPEFSKRRRNVLVYAQSSRADVIEDIADASPLDLIHVLGCHPPTARRNVKFSEWSFNNAASLLASADALVVAVDAEGWGPAVRDLVMSALLLERPVLTDSNPGVGESPNVHIIGGRRWSEVLRSLASVEDYAFISRHNWLSRAEQLMRGAFPESVSAVVLIHNNSGIIERCLNTILQHCGGWLREVVVVDNQSSDGGAELVEALFGANPRVKLIRNTENGCSSGRNLGVRESSGKYIAFFDSDQWLTSPSCFAEAVYILEHNEWVGTIGWNAGWFEPGRDDLGGPISDYLPRRGMSSEALANGYREDVGFLGTSCMFISRDLFGRLDGFDTFYDPTCFEDTDICFQIKRAGYSVAFRDLAGVRHQPHQTTGASEGSASYKALFNRNAEYFRKKWAGHPGFFTAYRP